MEPLLKERAELKAKIKAIDAKVDAFLALKDPTAEQVADADKLSAEAAALQKEKEKLDSRIEKKQAELDDDKRQRELETRATQERLTREREDRSGGRRTTPDLPTGASLPTVPAVARDHVEEGRWGFGSLGEFALHVREAGVRHHGNPTERMRNAYATPHAQDYLNMMRPQGAATGLGEAIGSEAGFLVPPTFSNTIFSRMYSPTSLLGRCDNYTIGGNSMVWPRSLETSRATGSRYGGVSGGWRQEGSTVAVSKPKWGRLEMMLKKMMAFAAITDEMTSDSPFALGQYLERAFTEELNFLAADAIINGTGAGMPMGILVGPAKVSVTKESGQVAATINTQNIVKMWARLWAGCRANAAWFINQDTEPQLNTMTLGIGTAGVTTYMPPGGLNDSPYGNLMGRPVIPLEQCATLGTEGDIILADMSHYVTISKGGGPQTATSIHLYFDSDQVAYRTTYRLDGQSWWSAPLTPYKGTATQSHIVTLATRS